MCNPLLPITCIPIGPIGTITKTIDFASDPMGYIAEQMQGAARGLTTSVLPALSHATQPDLSMDWFVSAYRVSFALAIFVWVVLLGWNLLQYARRQVSGDEVVESFTTFSPLFIIGASFGPAIGMLMVRFVGSITDALIRWGIAKSAVTTTKGLVTLIDSGDPNALVGGAFVAMIVYFLMILGLLLSLVTLLIMLVTLYFSGVVFPLGWVWITKANDRSRGRKIVMVWGGVLCAQPLLFLLLGVAMSMASGMTLGGDSGSNPLKVLVGLAVAAIALLMAGLSPMALLKFAPVGPTDAIPGGPSSGRLPTGSGRGGAGQPSPSDSQLAQIARKNGGGGMAADGGVAAGAEAGAAAGPGGAIAGAVAGGIASKVAEMKAQLAGAAESVAEPVQESSSGSGGPDSGSQAGGGADEQGQLAGASGHAAGSGAIPAEPGSDRSGGSADPDGGDAAVQGGGRPAGRPGRSGGGGLQVAAGARGAARAGNAVADLAGSVGQHAAGHMDHHREGPRGQ